MPTYARKFRSTLQLGYESAAGTVVVPTAVLPVKSSTIQSAQRLVDSELITGLRAQAAPLRGNLTVRGAATVPVDFAAFLYWLKAMHGAPTTGVYSLAGDPLPLSVHRTAADIGKYQHATGLYVGSLDITVGGDGDLVAQLQLEGTGETVDSTAPGGSPTTVDVQRIRMADAVITITGDAGAWSAQKITQLALRFNNNLQADLYPIGGGGLRTVILAGQLSVEGTITALWPDLTFLTAATGDATLALSLAFTVGPTSLTLSLPSIKLERASPGIDGPVGILQAINFRAHTADHTDASLGNWTIAHASPTPTPTPTPTV